MSSAPAGGGRLRVFRLTDVPLEVRARHATKLLRDENSPLDRVRIGLAIDRPSDRVYAIPLAAWERVMGP